MVRGSVEHLDTVTEAICFEGDARSELFAFDNLISPAGYLDFGIKLALHCI